MNIIHRTGFSCPQPNHTLPHSLPRTLFCSQSRSTVYLLVPSLTLPSQTFDILKQFELKIYWGVPSHPWKRQRMWGGCLAPSLEQIHHEKNFYHHRYAKWRRWCLIFAVLLSFGVLRGTWNGLPKKIGGASVYSTYDCAVLLPWPWQMSIRWKFAPWLPCLVLLLNLFGEMGVF